MRVIYLDLDCLRADHLGFNGYHRPTSPNMDALMNRGGVSFTNCYCSDSPCQPSRAAFMTGRPGIQVSSITHGPIETKLREPFCGHERAQDDRPMFPTHLMFNDIKTVTFSSFPTRHTSYWFNGPFEESTVFPKKYGNENGDLINKRILPWFHDHFCDTEDLFFHVNYWDAHTVYRMPLNYLDYFKDTDAPEWLAQDIIDSQQDRYAPHSPNFLHGGAENPDHLPSRIRNRDDFKKYIDGYDASIRYIDDKVGELLELLDRKNVLDETVFVISADHGECFGEQGLYGEHGTSSRCVHNIPMAVRLPGMDKLVHNDELIYHFDLLPSLCDLWNISTPPRWHGRSFIDALRGKPFRGREELVLSHGVWSAQRTVLNKEYLYQKSLHDGLMDQPDEAEMMIKQVVTDQLHEPVRQLPRPGAENTGDQGAVIIVRNAVRNAAKEAEGPDVPLPHHFGADPGKGLNIHRI